MNEPKHIPGCDRSRPLGQGGSTLLEVMIGALIVVIISTQMVAFFARGRHWFDQEEHKRVATLIAQEALEESAATDYATLIPWTNQHTVAEVDYATVVTVQANTPTTKMKTIQVVVTWPVTASEDRSVSLSTLVYDND